MEACCRMPLGAITVLKNMPSVVASSPASVWTDCLRLHSAGNCLVHGAWCMVLGAWCMVHGAWCMVIIA
eukprot:294031-Chlamydomonas_euryale.AAC.2